MIAAMLYKLSALFYRIHRSFFNAAERSKGPGSVSDQNKKRWYADKGDQTLRVEYDLNPSSVVLDIGGFEGDWASEMHSRYGCTIHIFEPVPEFISKLKKRFAANPGIKIHEYGLSDRDGHIEFSLMEEASSQFRSSSSHKQGKTIRVPMKNATAALNALGLAGADLVKINIEGGEYSLLQTFLSDGWAKKFRNIQVQFHDFVPGAEEKMVAIRKKLSETHVITWEYTFVWENWKRKDDL